MIWNNGLSWAPLPPFVEYSKTELKSLFGVMIHLAHGVQLRHLTGLLCALADTLGVGLASEGLSSGFRTSKSVELTGSND